MNDKLKTKGGKRPSAYILPHLRMRMRDQVTDDLPKGLSVSASSQSEQHALGRR